MSFSLEGIEGVNETMSLLEQAREAVQRKAYDDAIQKFSQVGGRKRTLFSFFFKKKRRKGEVLG